MIRSLAVCAVLLLLASAAAAQTTAPASPPPALPNCNAPAHHAFDFWIGEWDAYVTGTNNLAGHSTIAAEDQGCVITEHWRSVQQNYSGRSLNIYDRASNKWEQFWVDSTGGRTLYIGGPLPSGEMRIVADYPPSAPTPPNQPRPRYTRMTYTANPDHSVRQHGENSVDGQTWTDAFDFTYRPHHD